MSAPNEGDAEMSATKFSGKPGAGVQGPAAAAAGPAAGAAPALAAVSTSGRPAVAKPRRGYGGRSAEQLQRERRERLLEAALELFAERGYAGAPIEIICARARVTTRHFYEAFTGREALLLELHRQIVSETRRAVSAVLESAQGDISQRLRAAVDAFVRRYTDDPRRARVVYVEMAGVHLGSSELRRALVEEYTDVLKRFASALAGARSLQPVDYRLGALLLIGGISEILVDWLNSSPRPDPKLIVDQLVGFIGLLFSQARASSAPAVEPLN